MNSNSNSNSQSQELLELKKALQIMQLKMDQLQSDAKTENTQISSELEKFNTSLTDHKKNWEELKNQTQNSVLNDLEMELKKLGDKNEAIWKKLEQLSLRITILSQRNSDSMVLLKQVQHLVADATANIPLASNEEKCRDEQKILDLETQRSNLVQSNVLPV
ncbi:hypothetical protein RFI_13575, partial [Reticulomyxa filosa]